MTKWLSLFVMLIYASTIEARTVIDVDGDTTRWYNKNYILREVTVAKKRAKYSRKNNPAVELMRKVIAAKKRNRLENRDYYRYNRYQKIMFGVNDVDPNRFLSSPFGKIPDIARQIELCPYNGKLVLPVTFNETITERLYRKNPSDTKETIKAERSGGVSEIFQTGDILTAALKDFFTDVDIYDDQIRLLQRPFTSPIGSDAIRFYQFRIIDTLAIERDSCIHLHFTPNNPRDFGFNGEIYILKDSSYQVRRCELTLPRKSEVNFVEGMGIVQEFRRLSDGTWTLFADDMAVELKLFDFIDRAIVVRNTRLTSHDFSTLPDSLFAGSTKVVTERDASRRTDDYWERNRPVELTGSESRMESFMEGMKKGKAYKPIMLALKLLIENFIETGTDRHPSKVDIGPVNTFVSSNFIDGLRLRLGFQTTANLNPHLFFKGYYARGWKSKKDYYKAELTYSFNSKKYLTDEFPIRSISLLSTYDVCGPTDKFLTTDKDNVFTSLKWTTVDKMMFYRRNQLSFSREEMCGLRSTLSLKLEENEACGELHFLPRATLTDRTMRTTELCLELRYAPGEKIVNTKMDRAKLNRDVPVLTLSHSLGLKGFLGGQYRYNFTDIVLFRRFWVKSWGRVDLDVHAGAQWNKVPFSLLCMPAANLSYITHYSAFGLINNMEFLNDRYASFMLTWDLNGKIFNRIPLLNNLKWREFIGFRTLWGTLTDKNNPYLERNKESDILMAFPEGAYIMDSNRPYMEVVVGVHNVFRFFRIEYVRRLNYLDLPTANKRGVRFKFSLRF